MKGRTKWPDLLAPVTAISVGLIAVLIAFGTGRKPTRRPTLQSQASVDVVARWQLDGRMFFFFFLSI